MQCRAVQALLPEYVTGRPVPDRERVAGHLCRCEPCDAARRDLEAVFALMAALPEAPDSPYGEANTRFALSTEFAAGPLQVERDHRRREDRLFRACAAVSALGTAALLSGASFRWMKPDGTARLTEWAGGQFHQIIQAGPLWPGVALIALMGGTAAALPALLQSGRAAVRGRARREV
jgi:hypothetical protein